MALAAWADEAARQCGGRRLPPASLHMTLAFLGTVSLQQLDEACRIAGEIAGEPFEMTLDQLGYWRHRRIVWAGCSTVPSRQRRLFEMLVKRLEVAGFRLERRPFLPHVTLVRNAHCHELPKTQRSIAWGVDRFVLIESSLQPSGALYRKLGAWLLQETSPADKKITESC